MRRTQARQATLNLPEDPSLDAMPCAVCGAVPAVVVGMGADDRGALERAWCSMEHARQGGAFAWLARQAELVREGCG